MGFMIVYGVCASCKKHFAFNADRVPSIRINGVKEPICKECIDVANPKRVAAGFDPIVPLPDAYEAQEVE